MCYSEPRYSASIPWDWTSVDSPSVWQMSYQGRWSSFVILVLVEILWWSMHFVDDEQWLHRARWPRKYVNGSVALFWPRLVFWVAQNPARNFYQRAIGRSDYYGLSCSQQYCFCGVRWSWYVQLYTWWWPNSGLVMLILLKSFCVFGFCFLI